MEKINNLLKSLLGLLLIVSFVMIFSSCEKKSPEANTEDSITVTKDSMMSEDKKETSDFQTKMKEESDQMDMKYDSLKTKSKAKGTKIEKEVNQAVDGLRKEKDELMSSKTADKMEDEWVVFKEKSKSTVDKIEKKL